MEIKDIKDLIITINNTDIETVEIQKSDIKIMITKSKKSGYSTTKAETPVQEEIAEIKDEVIIKRDNIKIDEDLYVVKSPMVGTFYSSSSPDAAPFVKVGDKIDNGQTLCIIEAMKTMNEIESETSGEIVEILVNDEDIVEYGQALMKVRR